MDDKFGWRASPERGVSKGGIDLTDEEAVALRDIALARAITSFPDDVDLPDETLLRRARVFETYLREG